MNKEILDEWERFLTPEILRSNLLIASVYIAAYEILKNTIIERIREFFYFGLNEQGIIIDPRYEIDVLSKNKSPLYASLQWLKQMNAISEDDIANFDRVKKYRNKIAHEFVQLLTKGLPSDLLERFIDLVALLDKIERWWIVNVDIPLDPDLAERVIGEEDIMPGQVAMVKIMMDVALGSDEQAEYYIKEFIRQGIVESSKSS